MTLQTIKEYTASKWIWLGVILGVLLGNITLYLIGVLINATK